AMLDRFEAAHEGVADDEARLIRGLLSSYRASIALDVGELSEVLDRTGPVLADPAALPISELIALEGAAEAMAYRGETVAARALHDRMRELGDSGSPDVRRGRVNGDLQELLCAVLDGRINDVLPQVTASADVLAYARNPMTRGLAAMVLGETHLLRGTVRTARVSLRDAVEIGRASWRASD